MMLLCKPFVTLLILTTAAAVDLACNGCRRGTSGVCQSRSGRCRGLLEESRECPPRFSLCVEDLLSALLSRVEELDTELTCLHNSTFIVDSDGELIQTDCNGETTNLGAVVGPPGQDGADGADGTSCTVEDTAVGADVTCGNETVSILDGQDGRAGVDGADGADGSSCNVRGTVDGADVTCGNETISILDGQDGSPGADGADGADGASCTVEATANGADVTCANETVSIRDGQDGLAGADGADGADGASCTVQDTDAGADVTCGNETASILHGQDGLAGADGAAGADGEGCSVNSTGNGASVTCAGTTVPISNGADGADGASCTIQNTASGADVTCGSTTVSILDGEDGQQGVQGPPGDDADTLEIEEFLGGVYPYTVFGNPGKSFVRIDTALTWEEGRDACRQLPGFDYAKIETEEENDEATPICGTRSDPNSLCWIGLSDRTEEGILEWADGTQVLDTTNPDFSTEYGPDIHVGPTPS